MGLFEGNQKVSGFSRPSRRCQTEQASGATSSFNGSLEPHLVLSLVPCSFRLESAKRDSGPQGTRRMPIRFILLMCFCAAASAVTHAQTAAPPPLSIADIVIRLTADTDTPDEAVRLTRLSEAEPTAQMSGGERLRFHYLRAGARAQIGRLKDALADVETALTYQDDNVPVRSVIALKRLRVLLAIWQRDHDSALRLLASLRRDVDRPNLRGHLFFIHQHMVQALVAMGDVARARANQRRLEALYARVRHHPRFLVHGRQWEAQLELSRARISESTGRYPAALEGYLRARGLWQRSLGDSWRWGDDQVAKARIAGAIDLLTAAAGRMKMRQGRIMEGEADMRRALVASLDRVGKHNVVTLRLLGQLATVIMAQGRFEEAEQLVGAARQIRHRMGSAGPSLLVSPP